MRSVEHTKVYPSSTCWNHCVHSVVFHILLLAAAQQLEHQGVMGGGDRNDSEPQPCRALRGLPTSLSGLGAGLSRHRLRSLRRAVFRVRRCSACRRPVAQPRRQGCSRWPRCAYGRVRSLQAKWYTIRLWGRDYFDLGILFSNNRHARFRQDHLARLVFDRAVQSHAALAWIFGQRDMGGRWRESLSFDQSGSSWRACFT